jgi:oxygen-independent coproporphyrinogen-3 oxidase
MTDLWQPVEFDRELIKKYDRPGPRYTSYPTAPHFSDDFGPEDYAALLRESRAEMRPLSLYVHVPFCRTRCFFCGCNVTIARDPERASRYLPLLDREMDRVAELVDAPRRRATQIHWGGGTPTFVSPDEVRELMASIRRRFPLAEGCEIGVEVDPRRTSDEHLDALAESGVNRLSLGLQDLDPQVQEAVNRVQPAELTWHVLEGARRRGMDSVNVDLIYGLPHQTPESFAATVEEVVRMSPDRVALFNFAYLPQTFAHQRTLDEAAMPGPEDKLTILEETSRRLTEAGWIFIGMDHFAKPTDPLARALRERTLTRNFQGYSTHGDTDLLAFGASSISHVAGGFAQNLRGVSEYSRAIVDGRLATCRGLVASREDRLRRDVIVSLMARFRLDKDDVEARWGIDFDDHFAGALEELAPLAADGLVELGARRIEITPLGRLLVRNVAMAFDAHLGTSAEAGVRYSRTV